MDNLLSKIERASHQRVVRDIDYKAEVIAAGLLEKGIPQDQICVLRRGNAERGFSKDIAYIKTGYFLREKREYLGIWTNRQGFYDILPEGFFHHASGAPFRKSKEDVLKEIERQRVEEQNARDFFRPFEVVLSNALIDVQLIERKIDKKQSNSDFVNLFGKHWQLLTALPLDRAVLCMELITIIGDLTPSLKLASQVMELLLDVPIEVSVGKSAVRRLDKELLRPLGKMKLGINMVLGSTLDDDFNDILIRMGPIAEDKIRFYNKDEKGKSVIKCLISMLLPADREVRLKFIPFPCQMAWTISSNKKKASLLGVNSFINNKQKAEYESKE